MEEHQPPEPAPAYRLYKARFRGVAGVVVLTIVSGLSLDWFGPIANEAASAFDISLDEVNWLGNVISCIYIISAPVVPIVCHHRGLRFSFGVATLLLILSAWVRFGATALNLSSQSTYALLILSQIIGSLPQVTFQVLAPKYSETWFDLKGRTTATMIMSVAFAVGNALGQLISPFFSDVRRSVLVLAIISTAACPCWFLIGEKPPTPPSFAGSKSAPSALITARALLGLLPKPRISQPQPAHRPSREPEAPESEKGESTQVSPVTKEEELPSTKSQVVVSSTDGGDVEEAYGYNPEAYMTLRERFDFLIIFLEFGVLVAGINSFSLLSNQILEPYGYSSDTAGLMGAALLLSGLVAAFATAPLFDRVFTHHLALSAKVLCPITALGWFSLIWAVRRNNTGALYAIFVVIGACSVTMLPIGLELGCELTRNSGASSALLWLSGNLVCIIFVLVMSALRAPESANPPQNMHRALIFSGVVILSVTFSIFFLRGRQRRREKDAQAQLASIGRTNVDENDAHR